MKRGKKYLIIVMAMAVLGAISLVNGCKKSGKEVPKAGQAVAATVELCTNCGQVKGSDLCCKPGQPKCTGCSLTKGSPGCCKIPPDAQSVALCTKCGQIKGSDVCCKPNQPTCSKCSLVKGSPGCCKLPKT
jgi:hypothetical protein